MARLWRTFNVVENEGTGLVMKTGLRKLYTFAPRTAHFIDELWLVVTTVYDHLKLHTYEEIEAAQRKMETGEETTKRMRLAKEEGKAREKELKRQEKEQTRQAKKKKKKKNKFGTIIHQPEEAWMFQVTTGQDYHAGTSGEVDILLIGEDKAGNRIESQWIPLKSTSNIKTLSALSNLTGVAAKWMKSTKLDVKKHQQADISGLSNVFGRGTTRDFKVMASPEYNTSELDVVEKVQMRMKPAELIGDDNEDWYLENVNVTDMRSNEHYAFEFNCWFSPSDSSNDVDRQTQGSLQVRYVAISDLLCRLSVLADTLRFAVSVHFPFRLRAGNSACSTCPYLRCILNRRLGVDP